MNTNRSASTKARPACRIKTLLVDDSPLMLKLASQILGHTGNFEIVGST